MSEKIYLYPKWLRLWHLVNGMTCFSLLVMGLCIHFPDISGKFISFKFVIKTHVIIGFILTFNYVIFLTGNIITGNINYFRFTLQELFHGIFIQTRYYFFGIFKGEKEPFPINIKNKFNPLQKITYAKIMFVILPLTILTGLAMSFLNVVNENLAGGYWFIIADILHLIFAFVILLFIIIHFYFALFNNVLMSIVTGWHETYEENKSEN